MLDAQVPLPWFWSGRCLHILSLQYRVWVHSYPKECFSQSPYSVAEPPTLFQGAVLEKRVQLHEVPIGFLAAFDEVGFF